MAVVHASQRTFLGVSALLFAASAALTVAGCGAMSAMHGVPMPGGWTLSMMWMRMPGQSLPGVAAAFLGMWLVMMVAMMLPSLVPMLWRYRQSIGAAPGMRRAQHTLAVSVAYFAVWMAFGALVFVAGTALADVELRTPALARAVPFAAGAVVLVAGAMQFTAWKAHHLACCRTVPACCNPEGRDLRGAWRHGIRLGMHCVHCCFGLTLVLLATGMMDLRAMAAVTAGITAERVLRANGLMVRAIGAAAIGAGAILMARAAFAS